MFIGICGFTFNKKTNLYVNLLLKCDKKKSVI